MELELSRRIAALAPSPTVALNGIAKNLSRQGVRVYNFAVGEPDFTTPDNICQVAIDSLKAGRTKYAPAGGGLELRTAISHKLKRDNHLSYEPDQIVVGVGAKEILFHLSLALLNEGDEVLIPAPYWVSYTAHVEAVGAIPVIIPIPDDHDDCRLTPAMIERYATARTKAIILNSPNNPTGSILKKDELLAIGEYLQNKAWWIIGDEIYEYMTYEHTHYSLAELVPSLQDRYILVNGLSKGFAMTGWRVGYMAGPKAVVKLVNNLQSQSSTCLPPFIEDAAVCALNLGRDVMADKMDILRQRRDLARSCLESIENVKMVKPEGAFYIFVDIRTILAASSKELAITDSLAFGAYLLETYHVAMVPGEAFGAPGFLRLSYAVSEEDIEEGIKRLGQALSSIC